jgi:hypothetical protein
MKPRLLALVAQMCLVSFVQAGSPTGVPTHRPVVVTVLGEPKFTHRHYESEVEGVPEELQHIYQTWCTGEIGLRVSGLGAEPYRVHLAYTEMAMSDPLRRIFDIVLNGETVAKEVCINREVGNRRVLSFDFTVTPQAGVITYAQRRSVPAAEVPLFCLLQVYDQAGNLVAEQSAHAMRPADWDLRTYLDLTREHEGQKLETGRTAPPWPGTYRIRAGEKAKLTAADVLGPDGIAYPNWTRVGIPGGIPVRANTVSAADYGAVPDDGNDDSAALQKAIEALEAKAEGGGLFIPAGRYLLDRPIVIKGDNIVLRGAGAQKTRLVSRFSKRGEPPELHGIPADGKIHPQGFYYVWLDPEGLTGVEITAGGKSVQRIARSGRWETQIFFRFNAGDLAPAVGPGSAELKVSATYRDGTVRTEARQVQLDAAVPLARAHGSLAVIAFAGRGLVGGRIPLAADGRRGDLSLKLAPGHGLAAGDRIQLSAPCTPRWEALIETARKGAQNRTNHYEINRVEGDRVWIGEALRLEFPVIDGSSVQRLRAQVHCGVEDLGFEQEVQAMIHGVMFEYGWECWMRGVELVRAGDKSLYMPHSKRCEVRDSVFDRVWYNIGGSGYIGWEHSFDCLMTNVTTYAMRHAPVVQWASSGNVIRQSVFHGSDAQWHAGWTNENLYEELIVESSQRDGAYGNGMWASPPEDGGHGPNGPRNVVYNCSISSPKAGLWMGGMNESWLILHNRFVAGRGPGVVAKTASFDHLIQGNVFVLLDPQPAAIYLGSADCTGIELIDNHFYGPVTKLVAGAIPPALERGNRIRTSGESERPQPAVRSIYEWQQAHRAEIQAEQARQGRSTAP